MQSLLVKSAARAIARDTRMVACMSFSSNPLGSKEKGDEKQFFNKEDEKVLKDLLKKVQGQAKKAEAGEMNTEKSATALKKVFKAHKLSETDHKAFFDALLEWKKQ